MKRFLRETIQMFLVSALLLASAYVVFASWTEPTVAPTGGNVSAPLDVSATGQTKAGGLILNTGGAANGLIVSLGNVGIGTSTPQQALVIAPSSANAWVNLDRTNNSSYIAWLEFLTAGNGQWGMGLGNESGNEDFSLFNYGTSSHPLTILKSNNNVGIGTTTPNSALDVKGIIYSETGGFKFPDGTTQTTASSGGGGWSTLGSNIYNTNTPVTTGDLGTWTTAANFPDTRYGNGLVSVNGYLYVIGGNVSGTNSTTVYYAKIGNDGTPGTWTLTSALPVAEGGVAVTLNGYIYMLDSGYNTVYYSKVNSDGTLGAWGTTTALPATASESVVVTAGDYIYVISGQIGGGSSTTVYSAKVNSDGTVGTWGTTTPLPTFRNGAEGAVVNGYVYVISGWDSSSIYQATGYYAKIEPDGGLGAWGNTTSLPSPRGVGAAVASNGDLYVLGGDCNNCTGSYSYSSVYYIHINSDGTMDSAWSSSTNMPANIRNFAATIVNGYVYIVDGIGDPSNVTTLNSVFYVPMSHILATGRLGVSRNAQFYDDVGVQGNLSVNGDLNVSGRNMSSMNVVSNEFMTVFSTTSTTWVDVTGFSETITPNSASSRILVMANVNIGMGGADAGYYRIVRNVGGVDTVVAVPPTVTGYLSVSSPSFYGGSSDPNNNKEGSAIYLDSPGTASPVTYRIQVDSPQGAALKVNALGSDASGNVWSARMRSSLTLMDVN
ncbi:hypothetical protein KGO95_01400 [Patescibacteria group bacterium]|nr:hypothetical protein [Patescibacteria group bacterium]